MSRLKVLVCGSREWADVDVIRRELEQLPVGVLVHGRARGADTIAAKIARELGWVVRGYWANWDLYGKSAGFKRNQKMLREEHPYTDGHYIDLCLAFHEDPRFGKGTRNMLEQVRAAYPHIEVRTHVLAKDTI